MLNRVILVCYAVGPYVNNTKGVPWVLRLEVAWAVAVIVSEIDGAIISGVCNVANTWGTVNGVI